MSYFKRDDVVVKSSTAPVVPSNGELKAIVDGWLIPLSNIPVGSEVQGVMTDGLESWEPATELEYLIYASARTNLIDHQPQETKSLLWALNHATKTELRLGVNDPSTSQSVPITTIEQKKSILCMTQHWYAADRPKDDADNSTWGYFIMNKRALEPFIFLGSVIDTTSE